jgi:two-component system, NtrC family, response regulator AtoC
MRAVSSDYPVHYFDREIGEVAVQASLMNRERFSEEEKLKQHFCDDGHIVTSNEEMQRLVSIAHRVAQTDVPVLILGESGVGKEVFARFIHNHSNRFGHPFVKVNCAALPHDLLESELFGHERGAFTGAVNGRPGKFERANHGTLFLDEIAEITPHLQAKLLHVLQDGEFIRLGSRCSVKADVRIVAATNRKLKETVLKGDFRDDLYFRLNVIQLSIPPLRARPADIALLANHFLEKYRERYGSSRRMFPQEVMQALIESEWPGNVRQLENVVKRYLILDDIEMDSDDLPIAATDRTHVTDAFHLTLKTVGRHAADQAERDIVVRVLSETRWNRKECAKRLHISYKALRNKVKKWGLRPVHGEFAVMRRSACDTGLDNVAAIDTL